HWPKQDEFRGSPLHYAVISKCEASLLLLLSHGADPNSMDERPRSPLIIAAQYNLTPIAQLLVESSAGLASSDCVQTTALMCAAAEGNMGMIRILDQSNLVLSKTDHSGYTALHHAVNGQDT
ncbi:ankyrin repeat-containing domain protein, partial [Colletotrichum acutatum]